MSASVVALTHVARMEPSCERMCKEMWISERGWRDVRMHAANVLCSAACISWTFLFVSPRSTPRLTSLHPKEKQEERVKREKEKKRKKLE